MISDVVLTLVVAFYRFPVEQCGIPTFATFRCLEGKDINNAEKESIIAGNYGQ